MRRVGLSLAISLVALMAVAHASPASACTGCSEPLADVVAPADRVVVVTVTQASAVAYTFHVDQALKGASSDALTFPVASGREYPLGSRWILVLYPGHGLDTVNAWGIEPDGSLIDPGPFDAPTTLEGFVAFFAAPATATAPDSLAGPSGPAPVILLAIAALAGALLAGRRVRLPR